MITSYNVSELSERTCGGIFTQLADVPLSLLPGALP